MTLLKNLFMIAFAAPGQDGGGGGAPAGAAGGTPPGQPAAPANEDPFGFNAHLEGADPTVRPYLERVFGELGPQLQERVGQVPEQFQPLAPFMDRITPLLETPEGADAPVLAGLLDFYEMTGDENRLEEFADWFDRVGEEYGFFDDDDEGGDPYDPAGDDPQQQRIDQLESDLAAIRGELQQGKTQTAVQQQQAAYQTQLTSLMEQHGISDQGPDGAELGEEAKPSTIILRLASSYVDAGETDNAIEMAVRDYMTITGQARGGLVANAGEATTPATDPLLDVAHTGGGRRAGASLGSGSPDTEPEAVHSWQDARRIALSRLQAG